MAAHFHSTFPTSYSLKDLVESPESPLLFHFYYHPETLDVPASYEARLFTGNERPLCYANRSFLYATKTLTQVQNLEPQLGPQVILKAATPDALFVELSRTLTGQKFRSYQTNQDLSEFSVIKISMHDAQIHCDVTREWCYQQFHQTAPEVAPSVIDADAGIGTLIQRKRTSP